MMVEAIYYVLRTGTPWRDLPSEFPCWKTVHSRFSRWNDSGLWKEVWDFLKKNFTIKD